MAFSWSNLFTFGQSGRRNVGRQTASVGEHFTFSDQLVNETTAQSLSAVFACTRLYYESIAGFPLECHAITLDNGKKVRKLTDKHPLSRIFTDRPNEYQTPVGFWESVIAQLVAHGNSYCLKQYYNGRLVGLLPLMADQMEVELLSNKTIKYTYRENLKTAYYTQAEIWHVKTGGNGITGVSPLSMAREALGLALSADARAAIVAKNGGKPTGVLTSDTMLDDEQRDQVHAKFDAIESGSSDGLFVLEAGFDYKQLSLSPADAQLLETRKFQLEEICRYFGVPPALVGSSAVSVFGAGFEEVMEAFFRLSLRPVIERIESSVNTHLLPAADRGAYEFRFNTEDLLRMMPAAAAQRTKERLQGGVITPNEARQEAGYLPVKDPAADILYMQQQMVKLGTGGLKPGQVAIQENTGA